MKSVCLINVGKRSLYCFNITILCYLSSFEVHSTTRWPLCVTLQRPGDSILLSEQKAHQTSIYLGMCDKADWGVLAKQFLQNKPLLPKLARESLKCCELLQRGTQAKETISGEARSEETTLETFHFCLCQE